MSSKIHPNQQPRPGSKPAGGMPAKLTGGVPAKPGAGVPPRRAAGAPLKSVNPAAEPVEPADGIEPGPGRSSFLMRMPAWLISMLVHIVVLLAMALVGTSTIQTPPVTVITSSPSDEEEVVEEFDDQLEEQPETVEVPNVEPWSAPVDVAVVEDVQVAAATDDLAAAPLAVEVTDFSDQTAPASDLLATIGAVGGTGSGLGSRASRVRGAAARGGGPDTEQAVDRALKWIVNHQMPDGGWSFDLKLCPSCQGQCANPSDVRGQDRCGATALAILPFLGRGYTHRDGPYQAQIQKAIDFLAAMTMEGQGKAYGQVGTMYSQGLAGIALSECYGMTQDARLAKPAQLALNFIMTAQDPVGGGWRYQPREPGDTSAVGWQIMALKSGNMAYLQVDPLVIKKAVDFLDSVQTRDGAAYGYTSPGDRHGTNACGLLCRMYLGWKKDNPALQEGVRSLAKEGPSKDLYYTYHATQIMHHMEGEMWIAWNENMKKLLLPIQATKGHEAGSWYEGVDSGYSKESTFAAESRGRLYCTALATLTLEVYYRHLPIYGNQSVDGEFKE